MFFWDVFRSFYKKFRVNEDRQNICIQYRWFTRLFIRTFNCQNVTQCKEIQFSNTVQICKSTFSKLKLLIHTALRGRTKPCLPEHLKCFFFSFSEAISWNFRFKEKNNYISYFIFDKNIIIALVFFHKNLQCHWINWIQRDIWINCLFQNQHFTRNYYFDFDLYIYIITLYNKIIYTTLNNINWIIFLIVICVSYTISCLFKLRTWHPSGVVQRWRGICWALSANGQT